ncbi:pantothenate kinase 4 isoform X2 [Agrilus planipennis]|uniref:4'-phosphopantetheine phosphatase n=1 Tax=Agrilus planipennis TaxID=224129 RepID=A0A1W4XK75_AGRPL|nr:pantothenate kinase 4 isoform X2 [Agrilus planipennis]
MMKSKKNDCPLLENPVTYDPDTINLLENAEAREYWLTSLDEMVRGFEKKAKLLNPNKADAPEILRKCREQFHDHIENIRKEPLTLLETHQTILEKNGFQDMWSNQKERETLAAFTQFKKRMGDIDELLDFYQKWAELSKGIIAGNVFDWGAKAVSEILEKTNDFGLHHAMKTVQQRPWFIDNVDVWIKNLREQPYHSALIFVDNAGVDFVLGVLPFVRQLLIEGTNVYIAANSTPSLNDVTYSDLQRYLEMACKKCNVIQQSLLDNKLIVIDSGQRGPCLDLRSLNADTYEVMKKVDLLILEGMGRAVHTNFNAKFKVDCLKLAVLKNAWLARNLGASQFSVIFKYEASSNKSIS